MTKNYMEEIAHMLGVEIDEEFLIEGVDERCKITEDGFFYYDEEGGWQPSMCILDVLEGRAKVIKLPWKPQFHEYFYSLDIESRNVTYRKWFGNIADYALLALGMVYRTQEEAEANLAEDYKRLTGKPLSTVE